MRHRAERVRDHPVQRLHRGRRAAAFWVDAERAAERDHAAYAFGRLVRAVEREDAAQAPADQAHLAAALVVQVADLLLERLRVAGVKADVAAEAPRLHRIAAVLQVPLQREQRRLVAHEAGQQQHRMAVAARRGHQRRQHRRQRRQLEQRAPLRHRMKDVRRAAVRVSLGHARS